MFVAGDSKCGEAMIWEQAWFERQSQRKHEGGPVFGSALPGENSWRFQQHDGRQTASTLSLTPP
jgi:hypothetical protein